MTKLFIRLLPAKIVLFGVVCVFCQPALADSRQDAVAVMENLRQAGVHEKIPAEMESIEATFSKAEQYRAINDAVNADKNYLLVIQKSSVLKSRIQPPEKSRHPVQAAASPVGSSLPAPASPPAASSVPIKISVDSSSFMLFERRDLGFSQKQTYVPFIQLLGLDVDKLGDGNLSMHFNGWFRADLADKSFNNDRADGSLSYAYLRYRLKHANADVRAGRFFVREGIINEHVDGAGIRTSLPYGFGISAFGGANVHGRNIYGENSDGKGDAIFGGRFNYRYKGYFELGFSGIYESKAPTLITHTKGDHRLIGGDLWLNPHRMIEVTGRSSYNTEVKSIAEHSYLLSIKPIDRLVIGAEFNEQRDRSYLYAWSTFSKAALNPADKSRSVGINTAYTINKTVSLAADYKHYTRELGNADRYGVSTKLAFFDNTLRSGAAYHYLRASNGFAITGTNAASYHELRGYAMYDGKTYFTAIDLLGYFFREKINNKSSAWELIASLGYHFTPNLALSGDLSYGRNPQFTEETKGLLRLTYNTNFDVKGGK